MTDFGVAGVGLLVISDGTRWVPLGAQVLARSGVTTSVTGTTNETVLATVTVPAGLLGVSGSLRITPAGSVTNNANTKTLRAKLASAAAFAVALTTSASWQFLVLLRNRNSAASQLTNGGQGASSSSVANTTTAVDTTVNQDLTITGQLGVGTDSISLDGLTVEILP